MGLAGSASYANGMFTVKGAGTSLWGTADGFNFVYEPWSGDGSIVARVLSVSSATTAAGVVIRNSLNPSDMSTFAGFYNPQIYFNYRDNSGGSTSQASSGGTLALPYWVKLTRSGSTLSSYASLDGVNWTQVGSSQTINMGQSVYFGLGVTSLSTSSLAMATFDNVSLSSAATPAPIISSVSATTAAVGSQVVISGTGFGASQGASLVQMNDTPMTIDSWSGTSITVSIASGATSGPLAVSVAPTMNNSNPVTFTVTSQPLPAAWLDQDVGQVGIAGSASYANGTFTVKGAGTSLWGTADGFHFAYQPWSGDGSIVARVLSVSSATTAAGVVIRNSLNPSDMSTFAGFYSPRMYFNYRDNSGGSTSQASSSGTVALPYWVKLTRSGSTLSSYASPDGVNWTQVGSSQTINMGQSVYFGLGVTSLSTSSLATATFDNVSLSSATSPAPVISSVSTTSGPVGSQVVISGTGFGASQGASLVDLNGTLMTIDSWSGTSITVTIASGAASGPLAVLVAPSMNSSNPVTYTVTAN